MTVLALAACSAPSGGGGAGGASPAGGGGSGAVGAGEGVGGGAGEENGSGGSVVGAGGSAGSGGTTGVGGTGAGGGSGGAAGGTAMGAIYVFASGYGGTIATFAFDPEAGSLVSKARFPGVAAPSFLAWHSPDNHVYALNELMDGGRVEAFSVNPSDGTLARIDDADSGGGGPAHILVDPSGKWILAANYDGGTAGVVAITPGGGVGAPVDTESFGADSWPHQVTLDPGRQFAFVVLKGANAVAQFHFDAGSGQLTPNTPPRVNTADGVGPRHLAFRPDAKFAYLITEQGSTIIGYAYDSSKGTLAEIQTVPTRAKGATGGFNITAEIAVHPSGQWVYGSNRGDNTIVQYALGPTDGKMTLVGHTASRGEWPRHFSFDPAGRFMFVANENSDNLAVFQIGADGKLSPVGDPIVVGNLMPTFVGALEMP
jgi:6-phosphogluconolactonase